MLLKKLIRYLPKDKQKIRISGLADNSKKVKKNYIFFAINGQKFNGEKFISQAVSKGASVIICSKACDYQNNKIFVIKTSNIRKLLSEISAKFYFLKPTNLVAVTGTNGKTSVADLFYQIMNLNNIPVASIGTLGVKYNGKKISSKLTSPDTITLHRTLESLKKKNIDNVIIEASSHGLHQKRLDNLNFKGGIFTNFSQDHLDYHKSMKSYLKAKLILFENILKKNKTIISDSSIKEFSTLKKISKKRKLFLQDINLIKKRIEKIKELKLNDFQLKNLSMAILALKLCQLKEKKIFEKLNKIKQIDGRLELIKIFPNNIKVYVDFAHTPDALKNSLNELKKSHKENITLVFGCGGDRDLKKRPLMAKIASSACHKIYVTDDNPRNEKPENIRKEIIKYLSGVNFFDIGNRASAIKTAIKNAEPNEVILIAGKGHELKQIYKYKTISFSDKKKVKNFKPKLKKLSSEQQNFTQNKKIMKEIIRGKEFNNFHGLSIDSRMVKKNNIFLTIKGKNNDGSQFIYKALKKGAKYIISANKYKKYKSKLILVDDVIKFLNYFATKKRELTKARIFAITGSAGKTSLKNLIKDLLANYAETYCSPKSYNNHYGVPLSLSQLKTKHKFGVFEVGMSKPGEINKLSKLIKPDVAIITNIGEAHIENFKSLKGIADAKGEIINNIKKSGTIILNRDDKFFNYLKRKAKSQKLKVVSFGMNKKSDICLISVYRNKNFNKLIIKTKDQIFRIKTSNLNLYNILSSIALLQELNLDIDKIINNFKKYEPTEGRGKIHNIRRYRKKFKLIDESYNANPLSVKNAINVFNAIKTKNSKKYLLLGEMLELGKKSEQLHKNLSKVINNSDIDKVFIKGEKTIATYKNIHKHKRGNILQQDSDVDITLNNIIKNNDYLMIKGSNATGLNNLSKRMIKGI